MQLGKNISAVIDLKFVPEFGVNFESGEIEIPTLKEFNTFLRIELQDYSLRVCRGAAHLNDIAMSRCLNDGLSENEAAGAFCIISDYSDALPELTANILEFPEKLYRRMLRDVSKIIDEKIEQDDLPENSFADVRAKVNKYFLSSGGELEDLRGWAEGEITRDLNKSVRGDEGEVVMDKKPAN